MSSTSNVPFNDLSALYRRHEAAIEEALLATARSGWWLNGSAGRRFSEDFSAFVGARDCTLVANGTDALELTLRAVSQGDALGRTEIVTVANAGGYTTTACRQVGLTPVYVDVLRTHQTLDIEAAVNAAGANTLAIVATHLYGGAVDVVALRAALRARGLEGVAVIEDCAQAHGATVDGQMVGSMGDIATFSFYPTKNLGAMGDGGAVVTSSHDLAQAVRQLHQYGWSSKYTIARQGGRNSRMDELQAAVLSVLLPHLEETNAERLSILGRYRDAAQELEFVDGGPGSVAHLAVLMVDDREGFRKHMADRGIATDVHYPVLDCDQPAWQGLPMRVVGELAVSRSSAMRIVSLPCYPGMEDDAIMQVCDALRDWCRA